VLLTLWRHGEAVYSRLDSQRQLTERGVQHVRATVGLYRSLCLQRGLGMPTMCTHSPYVRTKQTASLIASELSLPDVVSQELLAPGQPDYVSGDYLSEESGHQLVVGHQPYLSQLIDVWCDTSAHTSVSPSGFAIIELTAPCRGGGELLYHAPEGYPW
jgi:phosphohistidine phosphatase SixA